MYVLPCDCIQNIMATDFRMGTRIKNLFGKITVKKNQLLLFCIKYYFAVVTNNELF